MNYKHISNRTDKIMKIHNVLKWVKKALLVQFYISHFDLMRLSEQKHCIQVALRYILGKCIISIVSSFLENMIKCTSFPKGMPLRTYTHQQFAIWGTDKNGSITRNHSSTFSSPLTCIQGLNASPRRSAKYKHYSQLSTQTGLL